jgi:ParB family chromosome partitioning protein
MNRNRLTELAGSLTEYGVLQPLLVRADGFLDDGRTRYMIIAGGRRHAAAQQAGLTHLPVVVSDSKDAQLRIIQLTENIQREELDAVEEARALKELMDLQSIGSRVVAERLHRSHTYVANRLKLIEHEDVAQAILETPTISTSVALEIARERDTTARQEMLREAATKPLRKEDAQRLRRGRKEPTEPPRPPTLREVAREMGASEHQVRLLPRSVRPTPKSRRPKLSPLRCTSPWKRGQR